MKPLRTSKLHAFNIQIRPFDVEVRFKDLTPAARAYPALYPHTPVAVFELLGHPRGTAEVLARDVSPFRDVDVSHWPARSRTHALLGLCSAVSAAALVRTRGPDAPPTLDLANRLFDKRHASPRWASIQSVDYELIRLLLEHEKNLQGPPSGPPSPYLLPENPTELITKLEGSGLRKLRELPFGVSKLDQVIPIYKDLDRQERAACLQLLAPYREDYLRAMFYVRLADPQDVDDTEDASLLLEPNEVDPDLSEEERIAYALEAVGYEALRVPLRNRPGHGARLTPQELAAKDSPLLQSAALCPGRACCRAPSSARRVHQSIIRRSLTAPPTRWWRCWSSSTPGSFAPWAWRSWARWRSPRRSSLDAPN